MSRTLYRTAMIEQIDTIITDPGRTEGDPQRFPAQTPRFIIAEVWPPLSQREGRVAQAPLAVWRMSIVPRPILRDLVFHHRVQPDHAIKIPTLCKIGETHPKDRATE